MRSHPVLNYVPRVASVTFRLRPPVPARLYITDAWKTLLHGEDTKKKTQREREGGRGRHHYPLGLCCRSQAFVGRDQVLR